LASRRLPEGLAGISALHEVIADYASEPSDVVIGIEEDSGIIAAATGAARPSRSGPLGTPAMR